MRPGVTKRESTERGCWKGGVFWDHIKTWFKEFSQKAIRMTPAKTPNNSGYIARTGHLL